MLLAADLDANAWVMIIGAVFLGLGQLAQIFIGWRRELKKIEREDRANALIATVAEKQDIATEKVAEVADKQDEATRKVAEVAEIQAVAQVKQEVAQAKSAELHRVLLEETVQQTVKLDAIKETAEKTAAFVNGATTTQLQVSAEALRKLADRTHDPKDIHAAETAEGFLRKHMENQPKIEGAEES